MTKFFHIVIFFFAFSLNSEISFATPIISVSSKDVNIGDTFMVPILIDKAVDLTFFQFDLSFNPLILQANFVTEGLFMSSFGTTLFSAGVIDNGTGFICVF